MEDKRLLRLIKKARFGDKEAFCEVIKEKSRKILSISTNLMGNSSDGEDAAQEAVITLARKIGTLKKAELFDAWMYRIVFNVCMDEKRRQSRKPDETGSIDVAVATIADERSDGLPEQNALNISDKETIMEALNELPEHYRMCMILFYYEDMPYAEIAKTMQVSEQVVANTLNRAREKMKMSLGPQKAEELGFTQDAETKESGNIAYKAGAFVPALALTQAFAMGESAVATPAALSGLASAAAEAAFPKGLILTQLIESFAAKVIGAAAGAAIVVGTCFAVLPSALEAPVDVKPSVPKAASVHEQPQEHRATVRSAEVEGLPEGAVTRILTQGYEDSEIREFKQNFENYSFVTSTTSGDSILTLYQSNEDQDQYVLVIELDDV